MREVWRQAHLKQPLGSRDGSRTRQRGGSGLKSTTGGSRGGSSAMARAGGVLHQRVNKGPHNTDHTPRPPTSGPHYGTRGTVHTPQTALPHTTHISQLVQTYFTHRHMTSSVS